MICPICNKPITGNVSIDHIYPRAIYKWQKEFLSSSDFLELRKAIDSTNNRVKTHHDCNTSKEDDIPNLDSLFLSPKAITKLLSVTPIIEKYIPGYLSIKEKIATRQNNLCFICHCELNDTKVLRRINTSLPRNYDNGCVLCHQCNRSISDLTQYL